MNRARARARDPARPPSSTATRTRAAEPAGKPDGRRSRGEDSRRRIVAAFIALVRDGAVTPTAEQVAEQAGVGLRTVFRHFDDMEGLFREIAAEVERQVRPIVAERWAPQPREARLAEIVGRRARLFERIMPFQIAADVHRHRSPFLRAGQKRFVALQREALRQALPEPLAGQADRFEAFDLVLSFNAWLRLRREQGLGRTAAQRAMRCAALGLAAHVNATAGAGADVAPPAAGAPEPGRGQLSGLRGRPAGGGRRSGAMRPMT